MLRNDRPGSLHPHRSNIKMLIFVIFLLLCSGVPFFYSEYIPLHDYPNHLVRSLIIGNETEFSIHEENYIFGGFLLPNIAADIAIILIGRIFSISIAGKIFVYISMMLCVTGAILINYIVNKKITILSMAIIMVFFNGILIWGFINYIFGLGVMMYGFVFWIIIHNYRIKILIGTIFSIVILLSHLVAFGMYALCVFSYEIDKLFQKKITISQFVLSGFQFLPSIIIFSMTRTSGFGNMDFRYVNHPVEKLEFLIRFFITFVPIADILFLLSLAVPLILALAGSIRLSWAREMRGPVIVCVVAFFVLPFSFFGSYFLDARIPLVLTFIALASLRVEEKNSILFRIGVSVLIILALSRVIVIADGWRRMDARYRALDFAAIGPGAALFTAATPRQGLLDWFESWRPPMTFAASYAALTGTFVPSMFADPRHQPLYVSPAVAGLYRFQANLPHPVADLDGVLALSSRIRELSPFPRNYVFVLKCHRLDLPSDPRVTVVFQTGQECLLRLNHTPMSDPA